MAVFRRKIIEEKQLRFVSEREYISEDYIFNFEFYLHSNKIGYLDSTFYHYRINPNSLTRKINLDAIKKAEKYARHIEKMITQDYKMPTHNTIFGMGYYVRALRSNMKFVFCQI